MFTLDMPDVPQHYASVVVAQANQAQAATVNKERAIGVCYGLYNPADREYPSLLSPELSAVDYLGLYEKQTVDVPPVGNVELVEQPKHGKVIYSKYEDGQLHPTYIPDFNYVGDETIVFKVNVEGATVKVVFLLKVTRQVTGGQISDDEFCKKTGTQWKISSASSLLVNPSTPDGWASGANSLGSWLRASDLSVLLADASRSFADFQNLVEKRG